MSATELLLLGETMTAMPAPAHPWRGQFVIRGPFPYGPPPISPTDQPFFLDEIDTVYAHDGVEVAGAILRSYVGPRRGNHIPSGSCSGGSYGNHYPFTRWIGNPEGYAAFLAWQAAFGIATTHFVVADQFSHGDDGWNIAELDAEYGDFYRHPAMQTALAGVDVCLAWETYAKSAKMVEAYRWLRALLPQSHLWWHNPPGHLSPGTGDEEERKTWEALVPFGVKGLLLQGWPPDSGLGVENVKYDIWDMRRRFNGDHGSPWGGPILGTDGKPLKVKPFEFTAHSIYNDGYPESIGPEWADALGETGDVLDGIVTR